MTTTPRTLPILRAARGLAQAELAGECGVSPATLSNIELGRREPSRELLERIARALACPTQVVAGGDFLLIARAGKTEIRVGADDQVK